jgi:GT2 family glycosyltransferase
VPAEPLVSVIIPVYGNLADTLACLDSIARAMPETPTEVIVVDDASTDGTAAALDWRDDIRYLRNDRNLGFIDSCNYGARAARGRHLLLLNNDTLVMPGWLDRLVETVAQDPRVGVVGSQLIYPDGRLQEAGAVIWSDANGWNVGRGDDPTAPRFNFRRAADYVSGCALLIPRDLFLALGGFDARFRPAYYEDTDLAFQVRAVGLEVVYQPLSRVLHRDGASHANGHAPSKDAHIAANRLRFLAKWAAVLPRHGEHKAPPPRCFDRAPIGHALIIDACTPTPDQDSGSADMFNQMRILLELGYRITFIPATNFAFFGAYTEALQRLGVECLYAPHVTSVEGALSERGDMFDLALVARRDTAAAHFAAVRAHCPTARLVFDTVDLHFLREQRQAALTGATARPRDGKALELGLVDAADATLVKSTVERALLARERPRAHVETLPLIREIPGRGAGPAGRRDLVFVGGFQHPPNVDAVAWFVGDILPLVRRRLGDVCLHVVGSNLPPAIARLGVPADRPGRHPVVIHGHVGDLAPLFASIRMSVAPLRYGAGVKGKVATSLCYGVPCIATSVAIEGAELAPGEGVLVAEEPAAIAAAIARIYGDDALWLSLSDAGLAAAERCFSLEAGRSCIALLLADLGLAPFDGTCPLCGTTGPFDPGPAGRSWRRAACSECGAEPADRATAAALLACLGHADPAASLASLQGAPALPRLLAVALDDRLGRAVAGLAQTVVGPAEPVPAAAAPFDGIVLGGPIDALRLAALADCLAPGGWLVMADPRPVDAPPIEHALSRRRTFLEAGLEAYREPAPRGRGVIEPAVWIARRAVTAG